MIPAEVMIFINNAGRDDLAEMSAVIKKSAKKFPKQAQTAKEPKRLAPDAQVRHDAFMMFKEWFLAPVERDGAGFTDFYFDGAQAGGLAKWIKKMEYRYKVRNEGMMPTAHKLVVNMRLMFNNIPDYWKDKIDFPTINGKFEVILQQISAKLQKEHHEQQSDPLRQARELANSRRQAGQ